MLTTNLVQVCNRVPTVHRIFQKATLEVRLEAWQRWERSKHACQNCSYFNDNPYLPCALHPHLVTQAAEVNECRDWEPKLRNDP
ncbi:MAG: hypothetical protein SFW36_24205 [Leptolyngbyaceae cyanobacterium bins.59]|nr:hypothetical protein [Leptolyngbyaceae cyanobacterium bins.59]